MHDGLRFIRLFSDLPADTLAAIEKCIHQKHLEKDEALIWEQNEFHAIYCIQSGRVDVYRLASSGREQIIQRFGPGDVFNLVPFYISQPENVANVKAVSQVDLLWIGKEDFAGLLEDFPQLNRAVAAYFAGRLVHMLDLVESLALFPVRQRLAAFLISQADKVEGDKPMRWTQDDIARRLGTVRDVIGRTLRKMEQEGLIRFQRQHILLLDKNILQKVADGDE